jgi:hypothetical protein
MPILWFSLCKVQNHAKQYSKIMVSNTIYSKYSLFFLLLLWATPSLNTDVSLSHAADLGQLNVSGCDTCHF